MDAKVAVGVAIAARITGAHSSGLARAAPLPAAPPCSAPPRGPTETPCHAMASPVGNGSICRRSVTGNPCVPGTPRRRRRYQPHRRRAPSASAVHHALLRRHGERNSDTGLGFQGSGPARRRSSRDVDAADRVDQRGLARRPGANHLLRRRESRVANAAVSMRNGRMPCGLIGALISV